MVVKKKIAPKSSVSKSRRAPLKKKAVAKKSTPQAKKVAAPIKRSKAKKVTPKKSVKDWFSQPNRPVELQAPVIRKKVPAMAAASAPVAYAIMQPDQINKSFNDHYQLPHQYGETTLALLARDPQWAYAYWEISQKSNDELRDQMGGEFEHRTYILRVYDVTFIDFNGFNAHRHFDIDVGRHVSNWYFNVWNDNATYCVELGARSRDGRFWKIARSNFVQMPRSHPSYRSDLIWLEVADNKNFNPFVYLTNRKKGSNGAFSRRRRFFLTDEELFAFFARYFQILKQVIWQRWQSLSRGFDDMDIEGADVYIDDILDSEDGDELMQKTFTGSSEEWQKMLKRRRRKRGLGLGADSMGASENMSSGSWSLQQKEENIRDRKFFFEIGTELIVYGRTEPDATVTLEGKQIMLRPDGTFSMRFALHDGDVPLGFNAVSINKIDKRQIATSVIRTKTKYKSS